MATIEELEDNQEPEDDEELEDNQELEDDEELFNDVFGSPERLAEIADDWEHDPDNPDPEHFS